jgi:peptidoglycan hydrolase-like protein with peptidoglycan-binding domain
MRSILRFGTFFLLSFVLFMPRGVGAVLFPRNLSAGISGEDVRELQQLLNTDPVTRIAESGSGSPGNESTYFGLLTKAAVVRFQEKFAADILYPAGLFSGNGFVGPATRAKLALIGTVPQALLPTNPTSAISTPSPVSHLFPQTSPIPTSLYGPTPDPNAAKEDFIADLHKEARLQGGDEKIIDTVVAPEIRKTDQAKAVAEFTARFNKDAAEALKKQQAKADEHLGIFSRLGNIFASIFVPKTAEAIVGFGGKVTGSYTGCNCPPGVVIVYVSAPRGGSYAYAPLFGTKPYAYYNAPYSQIILGNQIPGVPACWITVSTGCANVTTTGLMTEVGSK